MASADLAEVLLESGFRVYIYIYDYEWGLVSFLSFRLNGSLGGGKSKVCAIGWLVSFLSALSIW